MFFSLINLFFVYLICFQIKDVNKESTINSGWFYISQKGE